MHAQNVYNTYQNNIIHICSYLNLFAYYCSFKFLKVCLNGSNRSIICEIGSVMELCETMLVEIPYLNWYYYETV